MLQRVFKLTTLCMDTRSQSFPPLVNGLIHDALLQSSPRLNKLLLKNDFFDIPQVQYLQNVGEVGKLEGTCQK